MARTRTPRDVAPPVPGIAPPGYWRARRRPLITTATRSENRRAKLPVPKIGSELCLLPAYPGGKCERGDPHFHKKTARIANREGICDSRARRDWVSGFPTSALPAPGSPCGSRRTSESRRAAPGGSSRERVQRRASRCPAGSGAGLKTGAPAEGVGFEPTVPLPVHQLSGLANSATLAPLRVPAERGMLPRSRPGRHEGCRHGAAIFRRQIRAAVQAPALHFFVNLRGRWTRSAVTRDGR